MSLRRTRQQPQQGSKEEVLKATHKVPDDDKKGAPIFSAGEVAQHNGE